MLIGINVAVWLLILATGWRNSTLIDRLALLPHGPCEPGRPELLPGVDRGACDAIPATWFPGVADGACWQLVTAMFTHVEIWHIGFNMLALWFLGPQLEMVLGRARFLALYLVSGLAGSALRLLAVGRAPATLGASGAIFGLMGALLVVALQGARQRRRHPDLARHQRRHHLRRSPASPGRATSAASSAACRDRARPGLRPARHRRTALPGRRPRRCSRRRAGRAMRRPHRRARLTRRTVTPQLWRLPQRVVIHSCGELPVDEAVRGRLTPTGGEGEADRHEADADSRLYWPRSLMSGIVARVVG